MMNTVERTLNNANDSVTDRLDSLENALPGISSKALGATRASVRRVNDVFCSAASSVRSRVETVGDDATTAASTSTGQARSAVQRSATTIERGVKQTTGQARAAADPDDLATRSKAELYERAQQLDIEGRSRMSKAELIGALQKS